MLQGFPHPQFLEDDTHRTKLCQAVLKQVCPHKGCEPEPVFTHENRACFYAKGEAEENKKTRYRMDVIVYRHCSCSRMLLNYFCSI